MKKAEKNGSVERTIRTRSQVSASLELRRSKRGTPSKKQASSATSTRKSERLAGSPASVTGKSCKVEKEKPASPLQKSNKGKNVPLENSKGSDKSGRNVDSTSDIEESKDKMINSVEEAMSTTKKQEPKMTGRSYRALYRALLKKEVRAPSNDEELVVVGCSRRVPAENDDARDDNSSPHADSESRRLPVDEISAEKGTSFPVILSRDVAAGNGDARDDNSLPHANSELKRLPVDETRSEKDTNFPVKLINDAPAENGDARDSNSSQHANSESKRLPVDETSSEEGTNFPVKLFNDVPAENGDAGVDNSSPRANAESKGLQVDKTSLEKDADFPVKLIRDTENMVLDAPQSHVGETGENGVRGSPSEKSEIQKVLVSETNLETGVDLPSKRKRDSAVTVVEACAIARHADGDVMSTDGVILSPSGCKNNNQPESCSTCEKRHKVNYDFESQSVCPSIAQPLQEPDHRTQDMKESGPATSRDYEEHRQNMQQDKPFDPKLLSMYREYWVPVQLSDVQLEQYCRTLFSRSLSLSSLSKTDLVGVLEETLDSVRKTCDHPYVVDASLKQMLTKNLKLHEILDVEVKASGKLHLLDAMLTQIRTNGLKAVVIYQATKSPGGLLLGNILEDFMSQRFGQDSYEHGVCLAKKDAINNFNKEEGQCFVLLLESRACSQSIKLLRADAFILFGSSLNPSHDVKLLERIKIESYSKRTKIFRLYSTCTVEEKALVLARKNKSLENLNRPLRHALLMWGASNLFDKLDHLNGSEAPDPVAPFEESIKDDVIQEFSSILSSKVGEENEDKLRLLLEAKHAQGSYSTDSALFGEECVKLSDEDSPNIYWTKLLGGQKPMWKYCSDPPQRNRKRVRYLEDIDEIAEISNSGNMKKQTKATGDATVDNVERKASGKDRMGALESPKVIELESSHRSGSGTNGTLHGDDCFGLYSMGDHISGIPEDMLSEKTLSDIKKKYKKLQQNVEKQHEEKKLEVVNKYADKKQKLENEKEVERAIIRLQFKYSSAQSLEDGIKRLDHDHERKMDKITSERDEDLKNLEEKHEAKKKKLAEDEACWISRVEKLTQAVLRNRAPNKSGNGDNAEAVPLAEISKSSANPAKSASLDFWLNREETSLSVENNRISHVGSESDSILDKQNGEACSLDKESPDELVLPILHPASVVESGRSTESNQDDQDICHMPSPRGSKQPDPTANVEGQNNEAAIELQQAGSSIPSSPAGQQPDPATDIQGENFEAASEPSPAGSPICSSPAEQQLDPAENVEGENTEAAIEPSPAASPIRSLPAGHQLDPAANAKSQNIDAATEPQPPGLETVEAGGIDELEQADQVECALPSSPPRNDPDISTNIEGQNINISANSHIAGPPAVEIGDFSVSDQELVGVHDACPLPSSLVGAQADLAANTEGQNTTTVTQLHTAGSDAVETDDSPVTDQNAQDASPLPSSPPINQPDAAVIIEVLNNTAVTEPHLTASDACEMEIAEPGPQVEQSTCAENVAQLVHEGGVEPSASVTAPVPSLLNNGRGQSAAQPVPQIPFPVFNDPFQHELEKLRRESENSRKAHDEEKLILKVEFERKIAEVQEEYKRKFHEAEAAHKARTKEIEKNMNVVRMNKLLANAFLSKCLNRNTAQLPAAPRVRVQQLAQRAAQVSSLRNYAATSLAPSIVPSPAPPQPPASSFLSSVSRPSGLHLNSAHCPMPQPRQPIITNIAPSLSASPATNPAVNARLRAPAPHINTYRSSSPNPIPATTVTSSPLSQPVTYSTVTLQQPQQQQQQRGSNDVVCLSDDDE